MDKKDFIILVVILLGAFSFIWLGISHYQNSEPKELCVYKIPNEVIYDCYGKEVVAFNQNIFKHNNALDMNCTLINWTENYGYSYDINECYLDVPFYSEQLQR